MDDDFTAPTAREIKLRRFRKALIDHQGNVSQAAIDLEISRDTAHRWLKRHKRLKRLVDELRDERAYGQDESGSYDSDDTQ